ncbi:MAG: hypothetical protein CMI75_08650 [Candidatus Pelagibacter sp.]|jgi:ATP-dependent exoDNAse (exonuclease V) beta subunit|nr:hypothetical protein [Candidatus Pelagibacter sp.]|tara:strand:- start:286 stop:1056 length:771 start_codon:yes stop_codon:yes gene_type:complete
MRHISFSELKNWNKCAYYHKLVNLDKIKGFKGSEHTAFGTAIHEVYEKSVLGQIKSGDEQEIFEKSFISEIEKLICDGVELSEPLLQDMEKQGKKLSAKGVPALKEYFGHYNVFSAEEKLYEKIDDVEYLFKGYIDLVLKTNDGKYHIIDWKTTSWGWDARRRSDTMVTYQLTLYKHYFAKKHNIDPNKIETHFALAKRTASKDNIEIFRVSSGLRKTQNALKLLNKAIYNIQKGKHFKNRLSCNGCEFYKTKNCG